MRVIISAGGTGGHDDHECAARRKAGICKSRRTDLQQQDQADQRSHQQAI